MYDKKSKIYRIFIQIFNRRILVTAYSEIFSSFLKLDNYEQSFFVIS